MITIKRRPFLKGKKIIGVGSRRVVFDLGNGTVLKKAKSKRGIRSNKTEVNFYQSSSYKVRKHLAKIYYYHTGYRWIIMKKYAKKVPRLKTNIKKIFRLKRKFKRNGIIPYEVTRRNKKPNYENIRLSPGGRIVVIDFGNFILSSTLRKRRRSRIKRAMRY